MARKPASPGMGPQKAKPFTSEMPHDLGFDPKQGEVMVPYSLIGPLIDAKVGQVRVEMEQTLNDRLDKIDDLPTKWQLIAGATSGVIVTMGLLFAMLSYFGDRQDSAVDRSATISQSLTRIEGRLPPPTSPEPKKDVKPVQE